MKSINKMNLDELLDEQNNTRIRMKFLKVTTKEYKQARIKFTKVRTLILAKTNVH